MLAVCEAQIQQGLLFCSSFCCLSAPPVLWVELVTAAESTWPVSQKYLAASNINFICDQKVKTAVEVAALAFKHICRFGEIRTGFREW